MTEQKDIKMNAMNKTSVALIGAAFLTVALGACNGGGNDNVLYSCQEGVRSAKVTTDREIVDGQTRPVISISFFKRQGNIGSAASRTPIATQKTVHPTPAEILGAPTIADAYCANGAVPSPKL